MKRVLFLGAAPFQLPPIEYARNAGYYVLTCDNKPGNPGHRLAHQSHCVSTIDQKGVLELAASANIDGILSFGSDISALTAAVVARDLGLPGPQVGTIELLTNKFLFRQFLESSGLQQQRFAAFFRSEMREAIAYAEDFGEAAVIKPVDSSGSNGVSCLRNVADAKSLLTDAFAKSRSGHVIIEEYIPKLGKQVCGDGYMDQSRLAFIDLGDGHFHVEGGILAPFAETFPSTHRKSDLDALARQVELTLAAAGYQNGPFNLDALITPQGRPFIIEIGPRCGGNFIPTAIRYRTGVDLPAAAVESALHEEFIFAPSEPRTNGVVASYMLHSRSGGTFRRMIIDPRFSGHIVEMILYVESGSQVSPFRTARDTFGAIVLSFRSPAEMAEGMASIDTWCRPEMNDPDLR